MKRPRQLRALTRARVNEWLQRRHWPRVHMFFIVSATFLAGFGATKLLMELGVGTLWLRYAIAVCAAYASFLVLIRIWIRMVCEEGFDIDAVDAVFNSYDAVDFSREVIQDGGAFGGGGASGTWEAASETAAAPMKVVKSGGGSSFDLDIGGDEGCAVVIVLLVLAVALFAVGGYLIYTAPAILGEVTFEALLAAALARRAKKFARAGWMGSLFRYTIWPFLLVLTISIVAGAIAQSSCPEARRIVDAINCGGAARESLPD